MANVYISEEVTLTFLLKTFKIDLANYTVNMRNRILKYNIN
jgi:hypothetical protein